MNKNFSHNVWCFIAISKFFEFYTKRKKHIKGKLEKMEQIGLNNNLKFINSYLPKTNLSQSLSDFQTKAEQFQKEYVSRDLGLIAGTCDKISNLTGLGKNSHKALMKLEDLKNGIADEKEVEKYLQDYKYGQKDSTEVITDLATGGVAFGVYSFFLKADTLAKGFASSGLLPKEFTTALLKKG